MESGDKKKIGAVLVQGGGIAGIQAALDLANSGFKVYLVERDAAIGGMMSHLDKTFPTGDCATCIVSPKLVECARNINIEVLTLSELVDLKGEPGNFKAMVRIHPRYVSEDKCTACGQCSEACPVNIPNYFDRNLGARKAIAKQHAQATPNVFHVLKSGHSPCRVGCPANVNVQGYIQLIKKKEYLKAVSLIRERNPLSAICGRVCTHPCEAKCTRNSVDEAVAIRLLKRFASDKEMAMLESGQISLPEERTPPPGAKKVAVIGAGPSGLTVADDLAARGFAVTVYEASSAAGGMLRWGIPEYRLPARVLDHEIELIRRKGVNFVFGCRIGEPVSVEKLRHDYGAVFIGVGAQISQKLGVEGEDLPGVVDAITFLRNAKSDATHAVGERATVIGGGNAAIDSARTARRLGAREVTIVYRRTRAEMPASDEEFSAALEEGVKILFLASPLKVTRDNGHLNLTCNRMELGEPDASGRRRPVPIRGSEFNMELDSIISAVGQTLEKELVKAVGAHAEHGFFITDPVTLETSVKGVFAGGDCVSGPASVVEAVAAGKRAAESIGRYLNNEDLHRPRFEDRLRPVPKELLPAAQGKEKRPRSIPENLPVEQRSRDFCEVEGGLSEEAALAESERCLNCALCSECMECVAACEPKAIDHGMGERVIELEVGSVILAPGFQEFSAEKKGEFGFNRYPNVLTSVQFERMLSASGPFEGRVLRRSDGREARRIAWIQCVGSRDARAGNKYCSSVCCMVSTKQALVATDHAPEMKATIFYMDIRAHGKDFDQYYERAKRQGNIDYIKSMPSRVIQMPGTRDLRVQYYGPSRKFEERDFDLVVLSVGMEPASTAQDVARRLGIELNEYGFCATDRLSPLSTSRPGVFVAGAFQEPKDIPETVTQASAAASMSMELLAESRNSLITRKSYPEEHDVTDEGPRIGVFVCHCGKNIASVVDVERVTEAASKQADVVLATHTMYTCSDTSLSNIKQMVREHRLNRIVVASCTPRTHEPIFRETLREAGLNPFLFEMANIRDQCSWVHSAMPELATEKAVELVSMAIARARALAPLQAASFPVDQNALVIGGGVSGMTAALALADQGFNTHIVERSDRLGGNALELHYTLEHADISGFVSSLIRRVEGHPNIRLHPGTEVAAVGGFVGNFQVDLSRSGEKTTVQCGSVIVATGAGPAETREFLCGTSPQVITQSELQKRLKQSAFPTNGQSVVMIQCVGSRNDKRAYCSRICCSMAVKNALKIKERDPKARVFVLCRDIRTYGFREEYYQRAREAGVIFIRYEADNPPTVSDDNGLIARVDSPDFPEPVEIEADYVVLSTGIEAGKDNRSLAQMLKVPVNSDGFFVEAHPKLRPVDFASEGIFLCGLAHSPKLLDENISQARAAAARAATILSKTRLQANAQVSRVDQAKCTSCMTCVRACPYGAPFVNADGKAEVAAANCMGCGICVSECPAHAVQLDNFESRQFNAMLDELFGVQREESAGPAGVLEQRGS